MRRLHRGGVVERAVRLVPVGAVLTQLGIIFPGTPPAGSSYKIYCPFGDYHPDRGAEKEMRIYSDGRAYCHLCRRQYDSVALAAQAWGMTYPEAAQKLLVDAGFSAAPSDSEEERALKETTPEQLQTGALAALAVFADARGIDRFDEPYRRCLRAADAITKPEHVEQWLAACKKLLSG